MLSAVITIEDTTGSRLKEGMRWWQVWVIRRFRDKYTGRKFFPVPLFLWWSRPDLKDLASRESIKKTRP